MQLVVVESPSKAKTINKYLGKEYYVVSSKGHFVDLPKSKIGVDVENNFEPVYETTKAAVLKDLKKAYKGADGLILAADLDREGEAIAFHVANKLGAVDKNGLPKKGHSVKRIIFNEISKSAIQDALNKPQGINMDLFNAQQARRILDRLVGYKISPVLWKKISFGLSAGRVQSVALRLIVEREDERRAFKSEEYWSIESIAEKSNSSKSLTTIQLSDAEKKKIELSNGQILFELKEYQSKPIELKSQKDSEKILLNIKDKQLLVESVNSKRSLRNPFPPLITSTLQQAAVNQFGFTSRRTMDAAQKLYEKGFITYMRTDSVAMSAQAVAEIRKFITKSYGAKYLPEKAKFYASKSKNAQEAHECIRPVSVGQILPATKEVTDDMRRVYELISSRAIASQMTPATIETTTIKALVDEYGFRASGTVIIFDGYLKLMGDKRTERFLPSVSKGELFNQQEILATQHFTQPIARFSEASLIKKLEELGIGRPSTYASIISTIQARKYVEKDGRYMFPTLMGEIVNKLLVKYFSNIVDYSFTAEMEENLDKVAAGNLNWVSMLKDFYFPFETEVSKNEKNIPRDEFTVLGDAPKEIVCPVCGSAMIIKLSRFGQFYSCNRYPDCKGMRDISGQSEADLLAEVNSKEFKENYEDAPKTKEGELFILKKGRFGKYWAHPQYPKVKEALPLDLRREKKIEIYGQIPQTKDGKDYLLKKGKFGEFWAHPNYPKEKDIIRIPKKKKI